MNQKMTFLFQIFDHFFGPFRPQFFKKVWFFRKILFWGRRPSKYHFFQFFWIDRIFDKNIFNSFGKVIFLVIFSLIFLHEKLILQAKNDQDQNILSIWRFIEFHWTPPKNTVIGNKSERAKESSIPSRKSNFLWLFFA